MSKKVLVIGLDGASYTVLKPWMEDGTLPNMRKISSEGVSGELMSTIPPVTGPAWASFMTGKGPGSHGVYDFVKASTNRVGREIVSYNEIKSETIFSILTKYKKKVGSVNMPLTYPVPKVDGYLISGLLTPKRERDFTYPLSLLDELKSEVGEYIVDVWWQRYDEHAVERFLKRLRFCTEQRMKTSWYLMEHYDWDFSITVFIGTDRIQHFLWDYIFNDDSVHLNGKCTEKVRSMIIDYYRLLDSAIGKYMEKMDNRTFLIVMSDHGFGPLKGKVYINNWLEEMGYLSYDEDKVKTLRERSEQRSKLKEVIKRIDRFDVIGTVARRFIRSTKRMSAYEFLNCIDWSKTKAYAASNTEQGIYINLHGREPYGVVLSAEYERVREEIMSKLYALRHPITGKNLVSHAYKREGIYTGSYLDSAPDIVFFLSNGEYLADVQPTGKLFEEKTWRMGSGTHRQEGIFMVYGTDIKRGISIHNARIIDVAPTLFTMLGVPIPDDVEGRVLTEIFESVFLQNNPPRYARVGEFITTSERAYTTEEEAELEERLRGLGYI